MITQARLKEVLDYDPETGVFTWKVRPGLTGKASAWNTRYAGTRAGNANKVLGYVFIYVDGVNYNAHRLAWLYMTGALPPDQVDHKNRDRADNRWCNLRAADGTDQRANSKTQSTSQHGAKGVAHHKKRTHQERPWQARICVRGKKMSLGYFATKEQAHAAYMAAAEHHFGEFANAGAA